MDLHTTIKDLKVVEKKPKAPLNVKTVHWPLTRVMHFWELMCTFPGRFATGTPVGFLTKE